MRIRYPKLCYITYALSSSVLLLSKEITFIFLFSNVEQYIMSQQKAITKCVFPLFTESYTFQIKNDICLQGPFEIISRQDEQLVDINSFQMAPTRSDKKKRKNLRIPENRFFNPKFQMTYLFVIAQVIQSIITTWAAK